MITREQLLQLADQADAALKGLRKRLASEACEPPIAVTADVVTGLAKIRSRLERIESAVARACKGD